ncbi:sensor histidine kinase [Phaeocystidibacter marisrubri]|uniref:Signal transduction histidine kinase internal region domain-containing protein n=1 Tax=Phaeocystidibacter marisrubri TaxID=1577780 RepID=A0A6L3ZGP1_9FLAO|nr:histidine kinase [Phaeocystidibacter marisrubri]KAB2816119.1 hypothetical protein F8C82_10545 [Phaeocystidibacter marisrubri]GGH67422.1 histidine kinase [Phaeocystidibacter marisrubri]
MSFLRKGDYYAIAFISLFPILFFMGMDLLYDGKMSQDVSQGFLNLIYSLLVTVGLYVINSLILRWLQLHFPWQKSVSKRIVLELVLCFVLSTAWQAFIITLSLEVFEGIRNIRAHYISNITFGLTITLIVLLIMEGIEFFKLWRDSLTRVQRLEKQQIQAELDQLRAQVQPHFLFNSLNTLSAMLEVDRDIPRAVNFIDEFSLLYRRLLEKKEDELITLKEELRFVEAYLTLQKERFASALQIEYDIPEEEKSKYLLPLALQELLENAIKHNQMSRSNPLVIRLYTEHSHLCVSHAYRPKNNPTPGTGTGLENLQMRLRLIGAPSIRVQKSDPYRVCIPLIPEDTAEARVPLKNSAV